MAKTALLFREKGNPSVTHSAIVDDKNGLLVDGDNLGEIDAIDEITDEEGKDPQKVIKKFKELGNLEYVHSMPLDDDDNEGGLAPYHSDDEDDTGDNIVNNNGLTKRLYDDWQNKRSPEQSFVPESKANKVIRGIADKMKSESKWFNSGYDPTGIQTSKTE